MRESIVWVDVLTCFSKNNYEFCFMVENIRIIRWKNHSALRAKNCVRGFEESPHWGRCSVTKFSEISTHAQNLFRARDWSFETYF